MDGLQFAPGPQPPLVPTLDDQANDRGRWAQRSLAIAMKYDPIARRQYVLLPPGSVASGVPDGVDVRISKYSRATLATTLAAVVQDPTFRGVPISFGIDAEYGQIAIRTDADPTDLKSLQLKFGDILRVEPGAPIRASSRNADSTPNWAGARINGSHGFNCTSGPNINIGTTSFGTTAGHCGPNGTSWTSGPYAHGYTNARPDYALLPSVSTDIERITNSTEAPRLFFGNTTTTGSLPVVGAGDPATNTTIWMSGSYTGSVQGTVTNANIGYCDDPGGDGLNGTVCYGYLYEVTIANQAGDSGSVFHTKSGANTAGVRGTLSGGNGTIAAVLRWSRIASVLGATVLT